MENNDIKKALECCANRQMSCNNCPYVHEDTADDGSCAEKMEADALALINSQEQRIKELTEENEAWQKSLITQKENADKAYYELACEVENLRTENARYEAENHAEFNKWMKLEEATKRHHSELFEEAKIAVKEDTVRKMQERLSEAFKHYPQRCGKCCKEKVDQIAKEMVEDKPCT